MGAIDREILRAAIYTVSVRHRWAFVTDSEDRTEEIAAEYDRLLFKEPAALSGNPETELPPSRNPLPPFKGIPDDH